MRGNTRNLSQDVAAKLSGLLVLFFCLDKMHGTGTKWI